jgi:hypothetical protein
MNIAADPWIPVITRPGTTMVGLRQAVTDPDILDLAATPLEYTGLLALLVQAAPDLDGWCATHDLDHERFGQDPDLPVRERATPRLLDEQALIPRPTRSLDWAETMRVLLTIQAWDAAGIRPGARDDPDGQSGRRYPAGVGWAGPGRIMLAQGTTLQDTIRLNTPTPQARPLAPTRRRIRCTWDDTTCTSMVATYALGGDIQRPGPWGLTRDGQPMIWLQDRPAWELVDEIVAGRPAHLPAAGRFRIIGVDWGPQFSRLDAVLDDTLTIADRIDLAATHTLIAEILSTLRGFVRNLRRARGLADATPAPSDRMHIREVLDAPARALLAGQEPDWEPVYQDITRQAEDAASVPGVWKRHPTPAEAERYAAGHLHNLTHPERTTLDATVRS